MPEAVPIHAHAYQRLPLEPLPAERTPQRRGDFSSVFTASSQVRTVPPRMVNRKLFGAEQPLRLIRRPIADELRDAPPVPLLQVAHQRVHVLPGLREHLGPREARAQRPQQLVPVPPRRPHAYAGSRNRF